MNSGFRKAVICNAKLSCEVHSVIHRIDQFDKYFSYFSEAIKSRGIHSVALRVPSLFSECALPEI